MKSFESIGETFLSGYGRVISVVLGEDIEHDVLDQGGVRGVIGSSVKIDGKVYHVRAIEAPDRYSLYKTDIIGILV